MATLGELGIKGTLSSVDNEEKEDKEVGLLTSVAAAIPSGVIKIAKVPQQ